jgi:hypothetical protein
VSLVLLVAGVLVTSVYAATIKGTSRSETLRGTPGSDWIRALGGNDKVYGLAGSDTLDGGAGRDLIDGGSGNDVLVSRDGARGDIVRCGPGRDRAFIDLRDRVSACEDVEVPLLPPRVTDLSITLTGPPEPVAHNTDLTYVATVTNTVDPATAVTVIFQRSPTATYVRASTATGSCQNRDEILSWCSLGFVPRRTTRTVSIVIRVQSGDEFALIANVESRTQETNLTNNAAGVISAVNP